jgi:alpha-D-xyloside xylohydrolase
MEEIINSMMTIKFYLFITICISFSVINAQSFEKLDNGIILKLKEPSDADAAVIKIEVCADDIIRVTASPKNTFSKRASLMVNKTEWDKVDWSVTETDGTIKLTTSKFIIKVNSKNGVLAFYNKDENLLLQEKEGGGKIITSAEVMGEQTYHIQQMFDSPEDEAFYGLGAHQNDIFNYKNHNVDIWQYNIVNAIPFLVSSKNYGILWDNNSRTKFGDIRDYESISGLELYGKDGSANGLTAEYFLDPGFDTLYISRSESRIEHEFIDVNDKFPEGFSDTVNAVRWSGQIEAKNPGLHTFRLYCSGYTKMWIEGKLVVDSWRQNWLPWTHFPKLNMEAGKCYDIKIEWIHSGGYIGLKYLDQSDEIYNNRISLYSEVADQIDYYFVYGENKDEVIAGYREITGKAPMMPKWTMGLWQCRERYKTQEELLSVVREFRKRNIPLDNIVQDWFYWEEDKWGSHEFDASRFPDPKGMINTLHNELNTSIMISVWPKFYVGTEHYKAFDENGWLYKRNVEKGQKDWVGPGYVSTFYDPYNADAGKLFWKQINEKLFSLGIDAWWLDATEPDIHSNLSREETRLRNGPTALGTAARYLNTFSLMNSKSVYEGQRVAAPNQRVFILTRSAFAGQQRYSAATWSGDVASRWYDLKAQIPAGLNFSLSGIPYWTTDIGGFAVEPRYENPNEIDLEEWRELNTRWFQFGTFCPLFRVHGQFPFREMFNIAPDDHVAYKTMLKYDKLRYRLMPYIYSLTGHVTHKDYTIMRALVMDFGNDEKVLSIGDQFMFGPSILVNPVYEYKSRSRELYLPTGSGWYDMRSGEYYEGGQTITADAPYTDIPLFIKEGSIIPCGPEIQYTTEKPVDPVRLFVYTGTDCAFDLYEDENINYNYEKGKYSIIPISFNEENKKLKIGERKGSYAGMPESRTFEIVWITESRSIGLNFKSEPNMSVKYNGNELTVTMD